MNHLLTMEMPRSGAKREGARILHSSTSHNGNDSKHSSAVASTSAKRTDSTASLIQHDDNQKQKDSMKGIRTMSPKAILPKSGKARSPQTDGGPLETVTERTVRKPRGPRGLVQF